MAHDAGPTRNLSVREPVQERSRRRWTAVLDCSVAIVAEGGHEALTVAAVCDRAKVPPRLIYERVDNKDALLLAVYEHGMKRVLATESRLASEADVAGLTDSQLLSETIRAMVDIFVEHRPFLRAVVLMSTDRPEIRSRGQHHLDGLRRAFGLRLRSVSDDERAIGTVFRLAFSALVFRVAYGADFLQPAIADDEFTHDLVTAAHRLLGVPRADRG